jgi:F0F1-type ATP synthase epsilon subunit
MVMRTDASTGQLVDDGQQAESGGKPTMHVKVYSPFKVYFDQNAYSISGENATGPFDILPHHHNFITLLKPGELVLRTEAGEPKVRIAGGIMQVKADEVTVFLDV